MCEIVGIDKIIIKILTVSDHIETIPYERFQVERVPGIKPDYFKRNPCLSGSSGSMNI